MAPQRFAASGLPRLVLGSPIRVKRPSAPRARQRHHPIAFRTWETARRRRPPPQDNSEQGTSDKAPPDESLRYVLQTAHPITWYDVEINQIRTQSVPLFAPNSVHINGHVIRLLDETLWAQTAPAQFETHILDEDDQLIARIVRRFELKKDFGLTLSQRVVNHTGDSLDVQWVQYGPPVLKRGESDYIDRRRLVFGYQEEPATDPNFITSGKATYEYGGLTDLPREAAEDPTRRIDLLTLWPETRDEKTHSTLWFAAASLLRARHSSGADDTGRGEKSLSDIVAQVRWDKADTPPGRPGHAHRPVQPVKPCPPARKLCRSGRLCRPA